MIFASDRTFEPMKYTPFPQKIWLSSPTMHGDELKYITEAYETNWMSTVGCNINRAKNIGDSTGGFENGVCRTCGDGRKRRFPEC